MKNTMMKKFFVGLFSLLMGVGSAFAQTNMSSEMYDLAKMKEGLRNRRVSSYDRTGNNRDHLKAIKPGETAVLADIKGAGVINHIWITMSPGPRQLSRNDIILRDVLGRQRRAFCRVPHRSLFRPGMERTV